MDGELVWVECLAHPQLSGWGIRENSDEAVVEYGCGHFDEEYGDEWLAYRGRLYECNVVPKLDASKKKEVAETDGRMA